jgi:hypothetical protein
VCPWGHICSPIWGAGEGLGLGSWRPSPAPDPTPDPAAAVAAAVGGAAQPVRTRVVPRLLLLLPTRFLLLPPIQLPIRLLPDSFAPWWSPAAAPDPPPAAAAAPDPIAAAAGGADRLDRRWWTLFAVVCTRSQSFALICSHSWSFMCHCSYPHSHSFAHPRWSRFVSVCCCALAGACPPMLDCPLCLVALVRTRLALFVLICLWLFALHFSCSHSLAPVSHNASI